MFKNETTRTQKSQRIHIHDLLKVGEELTAEELHLVSGGRRISGGPTCCSTCSCEYSDQGQGY